MKTLLILVSILISEVSIAQKYATSEVILTAKTYLQNVLKPELFSYIELDSNSYYEYKNFWGRRNWKRILDSKRTKGKFINAYEIRFTLKHPDFLYAPKTYRDIYVKMDSALNLCERIDLKRIPNFLTEDSTANWLTPFQIDSIANKLKLKIPVKPISLNLTYDNEKEEYYWMVYNTFYQEKCFSDCEIFHIKPSTGSIEKHFVDRLFRMHCY